MELVGGGCCDINMLHLAYGCKKGEHHPLNVYGVEKSQNWCLEDTDNNDKIPVHKLHFSYNCIV